jgi:hypothetical protein
METPTYTPRTNGKDTKFHEQMKVSVYKDVFDKTSKYFYDVSVVLKTIQNGKYKDKIHQLRQTTDKAKRSSLKQTLPSICFSGIFESRHDNQLINHSGLVILDFDHVPDVIQLKEQLKNDPYTFAAFVSPSGDGLKVLFRIPPDKTEHSSYYLSIVEYCKLQGYPALDTTSKNVSRLCFVSYDPEIYINEQSQVFTEKHTLPNVNVADLLRSHTNNEQKTDPQTQPTVSRGTDYSKINRIAEMIRNSTDGNKHEVLLKAARLAGGYIAAGYIDELEAVRILESEIINKNIDDFGLAQKTIKDGITHGKQEPIKEQSNKKAPEIVGSMPIDLWPESIQQTIKHCSDVYQSHPDFWAASVIAAVSLAIGDKVQLNDGRYKNYATFWIVFVGNVSCGKSQPLKIALRPFREVDKKALNNFNILKQQLQRFLETPKKERQEAEKPPTPQFFQYIVKDYTPEVLYDIHSTNDRGLAIYRDELKGLFDDFNRYNKSGEQAQLLESWYNSDLVYNRKGQDPLIIPESKVNIFGTIQTDILPSMADDNRAENGFLSRLCFVYPDNDTKATLSIKTLDEGILNDFYEGINGMINIPTKQTIELTPEAWNLYKKWYDKNAEATNDEPIQYLKGVFGKLDVICLRLSIVFFCMNNTYGNAPSGKVTEKDMQTSIDVTEYFRKTALKVYDNIFQKSKDLTKIEVMQYLAHKQNLSQNEIARIMNCSQPYVNKILKNP